MSVDQWTTKNLAVAPHLLEQVKVAQLAKVVFLAGHVLFLLGAVPVGPTALRSGTDRLVGAVGKRGRGDLVARWVRVEIPVCDVVADGIVATDLREKLR